MAIQQLPTRTVTIPIGSDTYKGINLIRHIIAEPELQQDIQSVLGTERFNDQAKASLAKILYDLTPEHLREDPNELKLISFTPAAQKN